MVVLPSPAAAGEGLRVGVVLGQGVALPSSAAAGEGSPTRITMVGASRRRHLLELRPSIRTRVQPDATPQGAPRSRVDATIVVATLLLVIPGLLMLLSASSIVSYAETRDATYYLWRQLRMLLGGAAIATVLALLDYHRIASLWRAGFLASVGILLLVIFGLGQSVNGAQRWLAIGGVQLFQPGELIKPVLVVSTAAYLTQRPGIAAAARDGLLAFAGAYGLIAALVMSQPDMGTTVVIVLTGAVVYLVAGARTSHVILTAGGAAIAGIGLVVIEPYRLVRWTTFVDPWASAQGAGYHVVQALLALGSGGIAGVGPGVSRQKFFFLPFPHTDSIFAVLGEEFGLLGTVGTLAAFTFFMWRGLHVAVHAPDALGRCIAAGATMGIVLQALVNIAVLTSSVPFTGITLPFFSYGGSSIIASCAMCGLILSVSRQVPVTEGAKSWLPNWRARRSVATA